MSKSTKSSPVSSNEASSSAFPLPEVPSFDGTHSNPELFLFKLKLAFKATPTKFLTDESKSLFLVGCLKESALEWAYSAIKTDESLLGDYERLATTLLESFRGVNKAQTAMMQLSNLRQGSDSVSTYAQRFREIAKWSTWNAPALIHQFRLGLIPDLKEEMGRFDYPPTLQEMITHTLNSEERLAERAQERLWESRTNPSSLPPSSSLLTPRTNPGQKEMPEFWGELPEHRKTYITRYALGHCVYCGSSEHRVVNCDNKKPRPEGKGQAQSQK